MAIVVWLSGASYSSTCMIAASPTSAQAALALEGIAPQPGSILGFWSANVGIRRESAMVGFLDNPPADLAIRN